MGYANKMMQKAQRQKQINNLIKDVMKDPRYIQAQKKTEEQAALRAYARFCMMACDFLQLKHGYGKKRMLIFLEFCSKRLDYTIEEDEKYFEEMNEMFKSEIGLDVLGCLGMDIKKDVDKNE